MYHWGVPSEAGPLVGLITLGFDWVEPSISLIYSMALFIWVAVVGPLVSSINILWMFWMLSLLSSSLSTSFSAYSSCLARVRCYYRMLL